MVIAPAPAAATGRNSRSHSDPPPFAAATIPVKRSAAATGVPNRAPTVAAPAISTEICVGTFGSSRANRATMMPTLIAMIGFSGPRLTPPARLSTVTTARPGSTRSRRGGEISSVVAESGPPWPGKYRSADADRETREGEDQHDPPAVRVDAERVGQGVPEHAAQQVGQLLEGPQEQRRECAEHDRRDREHQELSRRRATVGRRSSQAHRGLLPVGCSASTTDDRPRHAPPPRVERSAARPVDVSSRHAIGSAQRRSLGGARVDRKAANEFLE